MNTNEYFVSKDKEVEKLETEGAFSPALDLVKFLFCHYFCCWEYSDEGVRLAGHSPPSRAEKENGMSIPPHVLYAWCLIRHRDNITFTFPLYLLFILSFDLVLFSFFLFFLLSFFLLSFSHHPTYGRMDYKNFNNHPSF
jgi:hypothetical protein